MALQNLGFQHANHSKNWSGNTEDVITLLFIAQLATLVVVVFGVGSCCWLGMAMAVVSVVMLAVGGGGGDGSGGWRRRLLLLLLFLLVLLMLLFLLLSFVVGVVVSK